MSDFPPSTHRILAELNDFLDATRGLPPVPHCFIARYDVPAGSLSRYRYWDTRGRLIVYVSRVSIEALPKRDPGGMTEAEAASFGPGMQALRQSQSASMPLLGIPVRFEEVR